MPNECKQHDSPDSDVIRNVKLMFPIDTVPVFFMCPKRCSGSLVRQVWLEQYKA